MAELPPIKGIRREDMPEMEDWFDPALLAINQMFEYIYNSFGKKITIDENIKAFYKDIEFTTRPDYNEATYDINTNKNFDVISVKNTNGVRAKGVTIEQITVKAGYFIPISKPVSLSWDEVDGNISIYFITGLAASTDYKLRIMVK